MNGKMVRYILGRMLGVEALLLLLPAFVGILYGEEKEALSFVIPAVILTCIFVIAGRKRPEGQVIYWERKGWLLLPVPGSHGPYSEHFHLHCLEVFRIL